MLKLKCTLTGYQPLSNEFTDDHTVVHSLLYTFRESGAQHREQEKQQQNQNKNSASKIPWHVTYLVTLFHQVPELFVFLLQSLLQLLGP